MGQVLAAGGEQATLERVVNKGGGNRNLVLHLFTNDRVPGRNDTAAAYTEATFPGYGPRELQGGRWTVAENKERGQREARYPRQVFVASANATPQDVFGYYYTYTGGELYSAERFPGGPVRVKTRGDELAIVPVIGARTQSG